MCTACGAPVPTERIRILARRDDVAFVELDCATCGSTALGLLLAPDAPEGDPVLDVAGDPAVDARRRHPGTVRAITAADVDSIRADLAAWDGDLVGWLATLEDGGRSGSVIDR